MAEVSPGASVRRVTGPDLPVSAGVARRGKDDPRQAQRGGLDRRLQPKTSEARAAMSRNQWTGPALPETGQQAATAAAMASG